MRNSTHSPFLASEMLLDAQPSRSTPIRFSTNHAPALARPNLYREFLDRSVVRLDVKPLDDVPFEVDVTVQAVPGLQLFSGRLHGSRNRRTREMLSDGKDDFSLMINLGGPYLISQGQREITLGDGEAALVTSAEPCSFTHHAPGGVLALLLPRAPFAPLVADVENRYLQRIPSDTPALRLLIDYVSLVHDRHTINRREVQPFIVSHIYDLAALAIGATRDIVERAQDGVHAARLHAIKADIASNLGRLDLTLVSLAQRHGCTPRFVQRLFEAAGTTFTEYVLGQRLACAHRLLIDPYRRRDKIATIAYDAGFGDVSYFNRMFRRRFGAAPSDVRAQARQEANGRIM
jgi:AraC-like DNA-binding protein